MLNRLLVKKKTGSRSCDSLDTVEAGVAQALAGDQVTRPVEAVAAVAPTVLTVRSVGAPLPTPTHTHTHARTHAHTHTHTVRFDIRGLS